MKGNLVTSNQCNGCVINEMFEYSSSLHITWFQKSFIHIVLKSKKQKNFSNFIIIGITFNRIFT